jgi:hypothetical protein
MPIASQARFLLSEYSLEVVRQLYPGEDDTTIMALYLGNLCARGDLEKIKGFIQEHESYPQHLHAILNCAPYEQWYGNCLHMVMFWNTGDNAMSLFTLLASHGAEYVRNDYEVFPCQIHAPMYIAPINGQLLGIRNIAEFQDTYQTLILQYGLDDSKNPLDELVDEVEVNDYDDYDPDYDPRPDPRSEDEDDYEDDYDPDPYAHCMHPDGCPSTCICVCYDCNP